MASWAVRSAQVQDVPPAVLEFLRRHEKKKRSISSSLSCCWERVRTARRYFLVCPVNGGFSRCISTGTKRWDWSSQGC